MKICGIDEAGRGPVIGPMVICGIVFLEEHLDKLRELGVQDSKLLDPMTREELYNELVKMCVDYKVVKVWPCEIDAAVAVNGLTKLELAKFADIIKSLDADIYYVDSPYRNSEFVSSVLSRITGKKVIAEVKADSKYLPVAAASIVAKVIRDREIEKIKEELGEDFGSGYPSDPRTIEFLRKNFDKIKDSIYVRKSWATFQKIMREKVQRKLSDFL